MKKYYLIIILVIISMLLISTEKPNFAEYSGNYTVYVGIDESLDFEKLNGFEFGITSESPDFNFGSLNLNVIKQSQNIQIKGTPMNGSVQEDGWDIYKAYSTSSIAGYSTDIFSPSALTPGIMVSLQGDTVFSLDLEYTLLGSYFEDGGFYSKPYLVNSYNFQDSSGSLYTFTAVPIPSSLILLCSSMLVLFGLRPRYNS